ncbi:MAG: hypothetical protein IJ759_01095 [Bacteroidales bacterium]|nr:hypothetical protein [Bacteroidales bacterium]
MTKKSLIFIGIALFVALSSKAQDVAYRTTDFNLQGYPKTVRYMKFVSDSSLKQQRTSYIEDYLLTFNDNRLLTERVNFINGQRDRVTKYEYNNRRQLISETISEADGRIASQKTYTYNNIGRLATLTEISYPNSRGGANRVERKEENTYNTKGLLVEKRITSDNTYGNKTIQYFYGPADSLISTITTYGHNTNVEKLTVKRAYNNLAMEKIWSRNDKMTRRETYEYNNEGLLVHKSIFSNKNKLLLTYTYEYDEHFNVISEVAIDPKNVKSIDYSYEFVKDKFFNWTKRIMYDSWAVKYTEVRSIEYFGKTHFYEDQKDYDSKRVIRDEEEKTSNRTREFKDQPVNQH